MKPSAAILRKASAVLNRYASLVEDRSPSEAREAETLAARLMPRRAAKKVLPFKTRVERKKEKRLTRKELVALVRPQVEARAGGLCECGCGFAFGIGEYTPEWDEFRGRKHVTVEDTWMLTRAHHRQKSENFPSRAQWEQDFKAHCKKHGYPWLPRLTKEIG